MERYFCNYGHFYRLPRDNPCLKAIEVQDSFYPCHDWNKRIKSECCMSNKGLKILLNDASLGNVLKETIERMAAGFGAKPRAGCFISLGEKLYSRAE